MAGTVAQYLQFILLNWFIFTCSGRRDERLSEHTRPHCENTRSLARECDLVVGTAKYILAIFATFEMGRYWRYDRSRDAVAAVHVTLLNSEFK